ncbi:uncharacterized protein LOC122289515 isoform X3 [Carya illinoinensis]|uniref:Uncharacterized protein n=1 Tax=Carya illinoinensis TaxID=32201 RepID=A0A8T1P0C8_CARIL|nr:uncharacterized protein LOC122289515 isoform X3 [Carya illinoinensis]XP_042952507.1 uncharacterized protein LOC122289515 isoform X3 [Carya illinoinensis]XP_042952508.1 uncharacterized protein LOC122289515 isoform X3 [Carya illinoinensis]XP_042952509.1 uncharacterized protein LOC122289515 isoform X3 [Carya illinoinensis]KAG6634380.1 hypothetical protein CIPAW_12G114700 [Carya illinoinensis]KAG6634381.1 hypothetical protein CIPAW_12G114700 [Carya illinoinensis]
MDLEHKRITWVRSFFQKLEDMCQEVDDIVSQDAIYYVENQLHSMGGSVKKFCSDVVEDVLPPLVDPIKREAQAVVLKSNAAISTYLQSMIGDEKTHGEAVMKQSHVEPNADDHVKNLLPVNQIIPTSVHSLQEADTVSPLQKDDDISTGENPNVNTEENATEESTTEVLESFSPGDKEPFDASLSGGFNVSNHENSSRVLSEVSTASSLHRLEFQSPPKRGTVTDIFADVSESDSDVSSIIPSKLPFSVVSGEEIIVEMIFVLPGSSLLAESCNNPGDCICHSSNKLHSSTPTPIISCENEAHEPGLASSSSVLPSDSIEEDTSSSNKILFLTESSGNRHIHIWEFSQGHSYDTNSDINDPGMETIELRDESSLDKSCVIVEPSELYTLSRRTRKLRSFRKMIQDAFASKKRVAQEYELLAFWHGEDDMGSSKNRSESIPANPLDVNNLQAKQECDSDWELL